MIKSKFENSNELISSIQMNKPKIENSNELISSI